MFGSKKNGILDPEGKYKNPLTGDEYSEMYFEKNDFWSNLPVYVDGNAERLIKVIKDNRVLILESGTGSGKTVLVPKYALHVLNYKGKVLVTVPKQVNASSTAIRDAKWMDVILGEEVGFKHMNAKLGEEAAKEKGTENEPDYSPFSDNTKLLFATGGTLVQMLTVDPKLSEYSIVVIDEAHERSKDIDESLLFMRRALRLNKKLKLIVMSATLPNADTFLDYFAEFDPAHEVFSAAPNKHVDVIYLPKGTKIKPQEIGKKALEIMSKEIIGKGKPGDILVFVDAPAAGGRLQQEIQSKYPDIFTIILAKGFTEDDERYATKKDLYKEYKRGKPKGGWSRKIIFATNVAESSLTFDGLIYVIDSGTEIKSHYNSEKQQKSLKNQPTTQAQATQRKGRVGRTDPGVCYRLYTERDFKSMKERPETSIVDEDMTQPFLKYIASPEINGSLIKMVHFADELMDPPSTANTVNSINNLISLSILSRKSLDVKISRDSMLTDEGRMIANIVSKGKLPDVNAGKAILAGKYYGCLNTVIVLIAVRAVVTQGIKHLFNNKHRNFKQVLKEYQHPYGDLFSFYKLFSQYHLHSSRMDKKDLEIWAKGDGLNLRNLMEIHKKAKEIHRGVFRILEDVEAFEDLPFEDNIEKRALLSLVKGYFPNIARLEKGSKLVKYSNFYPQIKTSASFDTQGNSFFSLVPSKKLPKYMFYIENFAFNGKVSFQICNVCPEELIQCLTPDEKKDLTGLKIPKL